MIGCSPWSQNVQERCEEDISVDKNESVTFLLMSTEEEIIVPSKLQRILVEKLSDQTMLLRYLFLCFLPNDLQHAATGPATRAVGLQ